eukprot:gene6367-6599_t
MNQLLPPIGSPLALGLQKSLALRQGQLWLPLLPLQLTVTNPPPAATAAPALPPANAFGGFAPPEVADPTGTMVYADPKYAPLNVQAAIDAQQDPATADPNTAMMPQQPLQQPQQQPTSLGAGNGAITGDTGAGITLPATGPTPAAGGDSVFANQGNGFGNRYTPSVGNAIGSSDLIAKMIINAPEQQVSAAGDALRAMVANLTVTPMDRIMVYQTRTINNPNGQPSLDLSLLFKNNVDAERTRQQNALLSGDIMRGFIAAVAQKTGLQIQPGSIKTSAAVNDGSSAAGNTLMPGPAAGAVPGTVAVNVTFD